MTSRWRRVFTVVGLVAVVAHPVTAQTGRVALQRGHQAYEQEFDLPAVRRWLTVGLDPARPPDSLWRLALPRLTEALMEDGDEGLARTWLRWAHRIEPSITLDTLAFPQFQPLFTQARDAVIADFANPQQGRARPSWIWTTDGSATMGELVLRSETAEINGQLSDGTVMPEGLGRPMAPGTYRVTVAAAGFLTATVNHEVLPGVTTVLDFNLEPATGGYLYVASRPWGTVLLNGQPLDQTPIGARRIPVGTHTVRIERSGYEPFETQISVTAEQRVRLGTIDLVRRNR